MKFHKHFRLQIVGRLLLIFASGVLLYLLITRKNIYAPIILVAIIAWQIIQLIQYIEQSNQNLQRFLLAIKYDDFSQTFTGKGLGSSFEELRSMFNEIMKKFKDTRAEKEQQY